VSVPGLILTSKLFDGIKHSTAPDLEAILNGKADVSDLIVDGVEVQPKGQERVAVKAMRKE
jgi:hypothetical protein